MADTKEAPVPKTDGEKGQNQSMEIERRPSSSTPAFHGPLTVMSRFADEMDRLFEDFGMRIPSFFGTRGSILPRTFNRLGESPMPAVWSPRIDIREKDGKILVRADLPGLSKDDVKVEMTHDTVTIQGERKHEKKEEREGYAYSEFSYGSFYRAIPLPEGVDTSKATAEFHNGVLEIAMPTPERPKAQTRKLEIQEKK